MFKICSQCKEEKPIEFFYRNKTKSDGFEYHCKECEHSRNTDRAIYLSNYRKINKIQIRKGWKRWWKNNKQQFYINWRLGYRKRHEIIDQEPCLFCGNPETKGHHPDYKDEKNVIWLCSKHHYEIHRKNGNINLIENVVIGV